MKFRQKEVKTRDFYGRRQITDLLPIDVNKVLISDKVPCSNGKDRRYIVGYQVDETLIPLFIKAPKNTFRYAVSQYDKNSAYTMSFDVFDEKHGILSMKRFGMKSSHNYLKTGNRTDKREVHRGNLERYGKKAQKQIFMVVSFHITSIAMQW